MKSILKHTLSLSIRYYCFVFIVTSLSLVKTIASLPSENTLTIGDTIKTNNYPNGNPPYFYADLDAAGYSDWILWGPSPHHPYNYHEVLSGEWGAAVFYDGVDNSPKAMWLTNLFEYPNWGTDNDFQVPTGQLPIAWNNPSNPTPGNDTGWSIIANSQVQVEIDYEVADLGQDNWSPLACWYDETRSGYVKSDRYVMLQTYTIRNITGETLTNLEFYQMLHSHGADDYGAAVWSVYEDDDFDDSLENYTPYNPLHNVGNFRYDITQWNNLDDPLSNPITTPHQDWVGFSTSQQPDVFENGYYIGGHFYTPAYKPPRPGTHWNIEDRNLNGEEYSYGEVAGALGWYLGSLDPNETTSVTVAFMFGYGQGEQPDPQAWTHSLTLSKTDDITTCVSPDDEITYTITYANPVTNVNDPNYLGTVTDVVIVDYLPPEVFYPLALSDPNYDIFTHTYTWTIGTLAPGDSGSVQLTVMVNNLAEPGGQIVNTAKMTSSVGWVKATETTEVCCYGGDVIYVDVAATGANIGTSWQDAYVDLQSALDRAGAGCGDEIWVAQGVYMPGDAVDDTFNLITGVAVYGGFKGDETLLSQRDPVHYKSILSGNDICDNVVKADDVDNTAILDGFTIRDATADGIACTDGAEAVIAACIMEANGGSGVYISASSPTINQCLIRDNGGDGVELYASAAPVITHCIIDHNQGHGVNGGAAAATIGNCYIKNSGLDGISIANPSTAPTVYNNTITLNTGMGIYQTGGTAANASNCILWANNSDAGQYTGCGLTYSCYYDPNNAPSNTPDGNHNITVDPLFAYDDPNHCHIHDTSPCKDRGTNYTGSLTDTDIDGDDRVINSIIDMGCDEVACSDIEHAWDFNQDSIINLLEFAPFAAAWLKDDSDQDWATHARCDFDTDDDVDLDDLCLFSEEWLWQACWRDADSYFAMMMRGGGGENLLMSSPEILSATELEAAKVARWRELQPAFEPTPQYLLWQIEDCIDWLEYLWATDTDFRKDITEADFAEFLKHLYAERDQLMEELAAQYEAAP